MDAERRAREVHRRKKKSSARKRKFLNRNARLGSGEESEGEARAGAVLARKVLRDSCAARSRSRTSHPRRRGEEQEEKKESKKNCSQTFSSSSSRKRLSTKRKKSVAKRKSDARLKQLRLLQRKRVRLVLVL